LITEEQGHLHVRQGQIDIKDEKNELTDVSVAITFSQICGRGDHFD
jgi:hypothetical protein